MTSIRERTGLDVAAVRDHFPALRREHAGRPIAFLDGPGGTQVPVECIDAIREYLERSNANHGGAFVTSEETDAIVADVRAGIADLLGAHEPDEIAFGPNMTTLTLGLSRAIARELRPADEIVLTRLDHDANVAPWLAVAAERGCVVRWVDLRAGDATLDLDGLATLIGPRTRLVAIGLASNALGTITDVGRAIELAHAAGSLVFVDAVHAAPHLPLDVAALRADFLACSPYKFFGPHLGVLYGRRELLERLSPYRVRPAGAAIPGAYETGTQNHEALAGLAGTLRYLERLGRVAEPERATDRRTALRAAMTSIRGYERTLIAPLLEGLAGVPGLAIHGIADPARVEERVPTVAFTVEGHAPRAVAAWLADRAITAWDGDFYAWELVRALGLEERGGLVRVGLVHYNTAEEVDRLVAALHELVA